MINAPAVGTEHAESRELARPDFARSRGFNRGERVKATVPPGFHCAHLDGNKYNNNVKNLAWVTPKENVEHKKQHGTFHTGEKCYQAKLTNEQANEIRREFIKGKNQNFKGNSAELQKRYGVSRATIHRIVTGRGYV